MPDVRWRSPAYDAGARAGVQFDSDLPLFAAAR
jgi:hypothetical protein